MHTLPSVNRRGLSRLQRRILQMAEAGRDQDRRWCGIEEDSPSWPDVWQVEVIADVLGLPPPPLRRGWPPSVCFSAAEIGRRQYNCAKSAVSRAVRRLEDRGLIEVRIYGRRHAAIRLAEDGGGP